MRRKLICIFFILVGIAAFTGTILLSLGRYEYADISPVLTLLILSIATVVAAARRIQDNPNEPEVEVSGRDAVYLRAFRAGGILAILACLAFIVAMLFVTRDYALMQNVLLLMALAAAGIVAALQSLVVRPPIVRWDIVKFVAALVIAASLGFVYVNYMPKYSWEDGMNMLRSDEEFSQKDVFYPDVHNLWSAIGVFPRYDDYTKSLFGGNPFYKGLFQYLCASYGYDADGLQIMRGDIIFNPATGACEYEHKQEWDRTYSPGEWPDFNSGTMGNYQELNWNFMCDKDGQHDAVLNLFFRESCNLESYIYQGNKTFTASDEWDSMMKDVMYPHNFPEDEARAFLKSLDKEALKTKFFEQITLLGPEVYLYKVKNIEIFFFGIDVGTYQNGEIVLEL